MACQEYERQGAKEGLDASFHDRKASGWSEILVFVRSLLLVEELRHCNPILPAKGIQIFQGPDG
jgi:hypothetical protein